MSIHKLYIRLFIVVLLVSPVLWLTLSDEGKRTTDLVLLKFGGAPDIALDFDALRASATEAELHRGIPGAEFDCKDERTDFGTRICYAPVASFNGNPARYVTFFFERGGLHAAKVAYRHAYHKRILEQLRATLGSPSDSTSGWLQWEAAGGVVVMPKGEPAGGRGSALMWLAVKTG
jgi:hypothetical protein